MCWEIDYKFFAEQKRAQETRMKQERRAGLIDQLLDEANRQGEKTAAAVARGATDVAACDAGTPPRS
jgi:hypothetical protein